MIKQNMPMLHLITQRNQPYMSVRKCCEICGRMGGPYAPNTVGHWWTDDENIYYGKDNPDYVRCKDANDTIYYGV